MEILVIILYSRKKMPINNYTYVSHSLLFSLKMWGAEGCRSTRYRPGEGVVVLHPYTPPPPPPPPHRLQRLSYVRVSVCDVAPLGCRTFGGRHLYVENYCGDVHVDRDLCRTQASSASAMLTSRPPPTAYAAACRASTSAAACLDLAARYVIATAAGVTSPSSALPTARCWREPPTSMATPGCSSSCCRSAAPLRSRWCRGTWQPSSRAARAAAAAAAAGTAGAAAAIRSGRPSACTSRRR